MLQFLQQPWPWYIAGPLIGLTVPALLILGNKNFGISSSLRHVCAACIPANIEYFKYDWKKEIWNLFFVLGIMIGGFIAAYYFHNQSDRLFCFSYWRIFSRIRNQICRWMYEWTFDHGYFCHELGIIASYDMFHDWWFLYGQFGFAFYTFTLINHNIFNYYHVKSKSKRSAKKRVGCHVC